jgi:hypothetical protein
MGEQARQASPLGPRRALDGQIHQGQPHRGLGRMLTCLRRFIGRLAIPPSLPPDEVLRFRPRVVQGWGQVQMPKKFSFLWASFAGQDHVELPRDIVPRRLLALKNDTRHKPLPTVLSHLNCFPVNGTYFSS